MIDIVRDDSLDEPELPAETDISRAVIAACRAAGMDLKIEPDLCIRFATDAEVKELNRHWRSQDKVTDVLSFPMQQGPDYDFRRYLGDIALAFPHVRHEAERLGLSVSAHCLHLIIHATLHLLGFDHDDANSTQRMRRLERDLMRSLGLHEPYPEDVSP